jgi:hypothetical protein
MNGGIGRRFSAFALSLTLGVWIGAVGAAFAAVQILFAQLSRDDAAKIAGEIFRQMDFVKYGCFAGALAAHFLYSFTGGQSGRVQALRWGLLVLTAACLAADAFWLRPAIGDLSADIRGRGGFNVVTADDEIRKRFGMYHGLSFLLWSLEVVWVLLLLLLVHLPRTREPEKP